MVAVWSPAGATARLDAALDALAHRGPDGAGRWASPDGAVALGHTRLAVIDPAGGAQPVASEDGAVVAVVNGELYDHVALGRELTARGHRLRGRGDAELLVHLYEERGDACVDALGGELAFVLWDRRRQRLLAGRDRFGIKPLVWARLPGGVALASEAKALFALGVVARWDDESFFGAAHTGYPWPDRTLFAGVQQVEPACLLIVERGAITTRRYWEPPWPGRDAPPRTTLDQAAAAVRAALERAVQVRTVADAPIAVQLSGGLDSTTVAALAVRHRADLRAFTVGFDDPAYDERAVAAATAAELGLALEVVPLDARAIADGWPAAVAHAEGLAINGHLVAKWALARAMRAAGCKVALTGEGADELFAGYPHLRRDALRARGGDGDAVAAGHGVSRGVMLPDGDGLPLDGVRARLGHVPTWLEAKATLGRRVRTLLSRELLDRFADVDPYAALIERTAVPAGVAAMHQSAHAWIRTALAQYILRTLGDGMEAAHGIEGRVPFLDPAVADVAMRLPPSLLVDADLDKPVLRRAVADRVPAAIARRPKHPFLAPPLLRAAPALVQDVLRDHARASPLVDRPRLLAVLDALPTMSPADQQGWDPALMLILSAAIVQARYRA